MMLRTAIGGLLPEGLGRSEGGHRIGAEAHAIGQFHERVDVARRVGSGDEQGGFPGHPAGHQPEGFANRRGGAGFEEAARRRGSGPGHHDLQGAGGGRLRRIRESRGAPLAVNAWRSSPTAHFAWGEDTTGSAGSTMRATRPEAPEKPSPSKPNAVAWPACLMKLRRGIPLFGLNDILAPLLQEVGSRR